MADQPNARPSVALRRAVELGHAHEDMAANYFASFDDR